MSAPTRADAALLLLPGFLDADTCAALRAAVDAGVARRAPLAEDDGRLHVDERTRRGARVDPGPEATALLRQRLESARGLVADWAGTSLGGLQPPQFLHYQRGDHFRPHPDTGDSADLPADVRARRVSLVVFLNAASRRPAQDAYGGGELVLFVPESPQPREVRRVVEAGAGALVAFDATRVHEVRPVHHGRRYTAVAWYR